MTQNENVNILKGKDNEEILFKLQGLSEKQIDHMMIMAASNGLTTTIKLLFDKINIRINCRDRGRYSPLMLACLRGNYEMAEFLINKGAKIDLKNYFGTTALMMSSFYGSIEIVKLLLKYGAKKDIMDNRQETALEYCNRGYDHDYFRGRNQPIEIRREIYQELLILLS